jgi:chromosome segregation ATPase
LLEPKAPVNLNLGELPELLIPNPLASEPSPNYLNKIQHLENQLSQIQSKKDQKIEKLTAEKEALQNDLADSNEQNIILHQEKYQLQQKLAERDQIIKELKRKLTSEKKQKNIAENNLSQEKQISHNLRQQLQTEQETNANLKQKLSQQEQNHTNLQNAYQQAIKDKQTIELSAQKEKQKTNRYENQLKSIVQTLYQWQKINYYQQLEPQTKTETQIIQIQRPPPFKQKQL